MNTTPTFTLRPTPGLKGCYDVLANGRHVVSQTFGRVEAKKEFRKWQTGEKSVNVEAAAVAVR